MPRTIAHFLLLFVIVIAGPVILSGQPKLKIVEGMKINYGNLFTNEKMKKEITIKNIGTDTLTVADVASSCGCTVALISNSHIPPKGMGRISITFDPSRFSGPVTKGISFETNDPNQPHAHVDFTVNVSKTFEVSSDYLSFPEARVDSTSLADYTLKNLSGKVLNILSIVSTSDILTVEVDKKTIDPDDYATITCRLRPTAHGIVKGNINIDTDNTAIPRVSTRFFGFAKATTPASSSGGH